MKFLKLSMAVLTLALLSMAVRAEDAPKPEDAKPSEVKPAETKPADTKSAEVKPADSATAEKPKDTGELPKAPEGTSPINAIHASESLIGDLSKGLPDNGKGNGKGAKKAAKKGISADALVLHVAGHGDGEGKKGKGDKSDKANKHGQNIVLTASGDILAQLTAFAEKHAHIKVTGALNGETMTVTDVSEAPADPAGKDKKKKKNNA